ncbi:hypothetical protein [Microvirga massiliensis]|uniref:hypothetical protein n=1 Tax=Microvirga massiliensis TaxID=1033741 RepID=UPI00062BBDB9|nr:hypothetical protein [Microvirga massiliensis]
MCPDGPTAWIQRTFAMPSSQKITANQHNARRSTGPRTAAGKAQSRRNAVKHGLAIPSAARPELAPDIAQLAQALAGEAADDLGVRQAALHVAEAALDVLRARHARTLLLEGLAQELGVEPTLPPEDALPIAFLRVQDPGFVDPGAILNEAVEQWLDALAKVPPLSQTKVTKARRQLKRTVKGTVKQWNDALTEAQALHKISRQQARQREGDWEQLAKLDRYERRALSRRNKALRILDEVQATRDRSAPGIDTPNWQNEPKNWQNEPNGEEP